MPEPDFEQIARRIFPAEDIGQDALGAELSADSRDNLIAVLRQVWNARGAADADLRKAAETVLEQFTRDESQGYHSRDRQYAIDVLGRALRDAPAGLRLPAAQP